MTKELLIFFIGGAISAVVWVTSTFATTDYVDKGTSLVREDLREIKLDLKEIKGTCRGK